MDWGKFEASAGVTAPMVFPASFAPMGAPMGPTPSLVPLTPVPVSVGMPTKTEPSQSPTMLSLGSNKQWNELNSLLSHGAAMVSAGAASQFNQEARTEAATKLIGNHERLLMDVCNPSPTTNIDNVPLTQLELLRVDSGSAYFVDEGLREVARRLLGRGEPIQLHTAPEAIEARAACARYLHFRIQDYPDQKPGRAPDMSPEASKAMKAVLVEVGNPHWELLKSHLDAKAPCAPMAYGAAAPFSPQARLQAARKIVGNHFRLINDVCNPNATTNADNIELGLTQLELVRVAPQFTAHVDEGLREVARRLLGHEPRSLNPATEAVEARAAAARYLHFRIQDDPNHKPGRTPDLSPEAAKAMKKVCTEVGDTYWEPIQELYANRGTNPNAGGAYSAAAREEAASKILGNHFHLLVDICNPSKHLNIDNIRLTQTELTRVDATLTPHIDAALRECVCRLLGWGSSQGLSNLMEAQEARHTAAEYLRTRIQDATDQKPGRKPDMSPEAKTAVVGIMYELANGNGGAPVASPPVEGSKAYNLASSLEHLATQLKLSGEVTPRHINDIRMQLDRVGSEATGASFVTASKGSSSSSFCSIM